MASSNLPADVSAGDVKAAERLGDAYKSLRRDMASVIVGQEDVLDQILLALFCQGHCILEGVPGVPALDDRVNGMLEGLDGLAVEIVGRNGTNCTEELGISVAEDLLTANPGLKAIYAACGPPAVGAAQAIENAGIANDDIVLVGFDACCGELEKIASGQEDATVAQFPAKMAELGVDALVKAINGETVPALIDSGAALVTAENASEFE